MANQAAVGVTIRLLGDGSATTATIVLDSTPFYTNQALINYRAIPDSVSSPVVADAFGNPVPASATLAKNGKQVLVTLAAPFTGIITVNFDLGYNV